MRSQPATKVLALAAATALACSCAATSTNARGTSAPTIRESSSARSGLFSEVAPSPTTTPLVTEDASASASVEAPTATSTQFAYYIYDSDNSVIVPESSAQPATADDIVHAFLLLGATEGNYFAVVAPDQLTLRLTNDAQARFRVEVRRRGHRSVHVVDRASGEEIVRAVLAGRTMQAIDQQLVANESSR